MLQAVFPKRASREIVIGLLGCNHAPIGDKLGTLVGFELQRTESDILVAVLLSCLENHITVLPIHDAVLCPASKADQVEEVMLDAFKANTGRTSASVSRGASPLE